MFGKRGWLSGQIGLVLFSFFFHFPCPPHFEKGGCLTPVSYVHFSGVLIITLRSVSCKRIVLAGR